jgi:membrane fusion protein, multidrug efflux system
MHRAAAAVLASAACLAACGADEAAAPPPPEVLFVPVVARDVPEVSEWLGTTEGFVDAQIRSQVAGYLISRDYQEGALVTKGTLLFHIDPRPFQATLDQASGDLGRANAELALGRQDVARYAPLVESGAVSRQEYDNAMQRLHSSEAAVQTARGAVDKAKIDLGFTEIRSPIDGLVGVAVHQLGDFVSPTDPQPLTTVSQLDPIRVSFPVSEQEYLRYAPRIREAVRSGSFPKGAEQLILADGSLYPHRGTGHPAGREVDPQTGTILVKGVFPNPDYLLRPGQYARVRVNMDTLAGALVVPQRAVQELQGLAQLAVIGDDDKIELRTVVPGPAWGTLRVISKGVRAGERVVVEGIQKVQDGSPVTPTLAPPELAGAPPKDDAPPAAPPPAAS